MLHLARRDEERMDGSCRRCGGLVWRRRPGSVERSLALHVAALLLFVLAHAFTFMTLEIEGRFQPAHIATGVVELARGSYWPLAVLVALVAIVIPAAKILAGIAVLSAASRGRITPSSVRVFHLIETLRPWAMMEVYLLGVIVAWVKLSDIAQLIPGPGVFAFVGLVVVMTAAEAVLEPTEVWERIETQADALLLRSRPGTQLVGCPACGQMDRLTPEEIDRAIACSRCGTPLHRRKTNARARTWAYLIAAAVFYVPANLYPVMTVVYFGSGEPDTILSGVATLLDAGMLPVAALVFFASIVVPVLKIVGLVWLLVATGARSPGGLVARTKAYRIIEGVGRWSMVDIFMIAILAALVQLGSIATILPGPGAMCFAAVVVLTLLASMSFDPRLMWDAVENRDGDEQPARA